MPQQDWVGLAAETNKMELASRPVDFLIFEFIFLKPVLFLFLVYYCFIFFRILGLAWAGVFCCFYCLRLAYTGHDLRHVVMRRVS